MLYANAKRNQEYIDEEELAKKIVFERTVKWVNKLYPDDNKEVSLKKPDKLSSQLQYELDKLFGSFRASVDELINASYNNSISHEKSYNIIQRYNQISSFLKNIVTTNQIGESDEEKIKRNFNDMIPKLLILRKIVEDNDFSYRDDILDMINKITSTTSTKQTEFEKVSDKSEGMINKIETKHGAIEALTQSLKSIKQIIRTVNENQYISEDKQLDANIDKFMDFFSKYEQSEMNSSDYPIVIENAKKLNIVIGQVNKEVGRYQDTFIKFNDMTDEILDMIETVTHKSKISKYIDDMLHKFPDIDPIVASEDLSDIISPFQRQIESKGFQDKVNEFDDFARHSTFDELYIKDKYVASLEYLTKVKAYVSAYTGRLYGAIDNYFKRGPYKNLSIKLVDPMEEKHSDVKNALTVHVPGTKVVKGYDLRDRKPKPSAHDNIDVSSVIYQNQNSFEKAVTEAITANRKYPKGESPFKFKLRAYTTHYPTQWAKYQTLTKHEQITFFDIE